MNKWLRWLCLLVLPVGAFFALPIEAQERAISVTDITVTGFGAHNFSAGGTNGNYILSKNTAAGASNYAGFIAENDTGVDGFFRTYSSTFSNTGYAFANGAVVGGDGAGGLSVVAAHASGGIRFYTGGTTSKWDINAAGDFRHASGIMESAGAPTLTTCTNCGTAAILGIDSVFNVTTGVGTAAQTILVTFGHQFDQIPSCNPSTDVAGITFTVTPTVNAVTFVTSGNLGTSKHVYVNCRGY